MTEQAIKALVNHVQVEKNAENVFDRAFPHALELVRVLLKLNPPLLKEDERQKLTEIEKKLSIPRDQWAALQDYHQVIEKYNTLLQALHIPNVKPLSEIEPQLSDVVSKKDKKLSERKAFERIAGNASVLNKYNVNKTLLKNLKSDFELKIAKNQKEYNEAMRQFSILKQGAAPNLLEDYNRIQVLNKNLGEKTFTSAAEEQAMLASLQKLEREMLKHINKQQKSPLSAKEKVILDQMKKEYNSMFAELGYSHKESYLTKNPLNKLELDKIIKEVIGYKATNPTYGKFLQDKRIADRDALGKLYEGYEKGGANFERKPLMDALIKRGEACERLERNMRRLEKAFQEAEKVPQRNIAALPKDVIMKYEQMSNAIAVLETQEAELNRQKDLATQNEKLKTLHAAGVKAHERLSGDLNKLMDLQVNFIVVQAELTALVSEMGNQKDGMWAKLQSLKNMSPALYEKFTSGKQALIEDVYNALKAGNDQIAWKAESATTVLEERTKVVGNTKDTLETNRQKFSELIASLDTAIKAEKDTQLARFNTAKVQLEDNLSRIRGLRGFVNNPVIQQQEELWKKLVSLGEQLKLKDVDHPAVEKGREVLLKINTTGIGETSPADTLKSNTDEMEGINKRLGKLIVVFEEATKKQELAAAELALKEETQRREAAQVRVRAEVERSRTEEAARLAEELRKAEEAQKRDASTQDKALQTAIQKVQALQNQLIDFRDKNSDIYNKMIPSNSDTNRLVTANLAVKFDSTKASPQQVLDFLKDVPERLKTLQTQEQTLSAAFTSLQAEKSRLELEAARAAEQQQAARLAAEHAEAAAAAARLIDAERQRAEIEARQKEVDRQKEEARLREETQRQQLEDQRLKDEQQRLQKEQARLRETAALESTRTAEKAKMAEAERKTKLKELQTKRDALSAMVAHTAPGIIPKIIGVEGTIAKLQTLVSDTGKYQGEMDNASNLVEKSTNNVVKSTSIIRGVEGILDDKNANIETIYAKIGELDGVIAVVKKDHADLSTAQDSLNNAVQNITRAQEEARLRTLAAEQQRRDEEQRRKVIDLETQRNIDAERRKAVLQKTKAETAEVLKITEAATPQVTNPSLPSLPKDPTTRPHTSASLAESLNLVQVRSDHSSRSGSAPKRKSLFFKLEVTEKLKEVAAFDISQNPKMVLETEVTPKQFADTCEDLRKELNAVSNPLNRNPLYGKAFDDLRCDWVSTDKKDNFRFFNKDNPDQSLIEVTYSSDKKLPTQKKIEIISSNLHPEDEALFAKVITAKKIFDDYNSSLPPGRKPRNDFKIENCEAQPEVALKLYLLGKSLGLEPNFKDAPDQHNATLNSILNSPRKLYIENNGVEESITYKDIYNKVQSGQLTTEEIKNYIQLLKSDQEPKETIRPAGA